MNNINNIFLFIFIFSLLNCLRLVFKFISALLRNPPSQMVMSSRELFFNGLSISYLITYIIKEF